MSEHERRLYDIPPGDTARILALMYTLGYFSLVMTLMWQGIPAENKDVVNTLVGMLTIIQTGIVGFYFGGSKSAEIAQKAGVVGRVQADTAIQQIAKAIPAIDPIKTNAMNVDATNADIKIEPSARLKTKGKK